MISILIPAYNVEKYIKTTINSVLSQTYKDIEIIVIDDCSTDNTPNIIQGIATLDKRIIFLKNDVNKGLTANRNLTLKRAKGEYIMFVDADDYLYPNAVEIMYTLAKKKNSDIVIGGSSYVQNPDNNQDFLSLKHFIFNPSHKPGYYNNRKFITDPTAVTL
jgi:glycosyltransferase involved in cell wall biosynthesis